MFSGRRSTSGNAPDEDEFSAAALDLLDPLYGAALRLTRNSDRAQDLPGLARPAAELRVLGHDEVVWTQGDRTYMLVADAGAMAGLTRVASYLRNEAE